MTRTGYTKTQQTGIPSESMQRTAAVHHPHSLAILKGMLLLLGLLLAWGVISRLFSSIPLKRIRVEGLTRYGEEEVLVTSGLSEVDKLLGVEAETAEQALLDFYPYIRSVRVRYVFPLSYRVTIEEEIPLYYTRIANDYFALSEDLKVLERTTSPRRFLDEGLQQISIGGINSAMVGQTLDYGGDYLSQVLAEIEDSDLAGRITEVHIGDRYHLSVVCDGLYTLYLGEITAIDSKLQIAALMLQDAKVPEGYRATLDVSNPKKTSIRYEGILDATFSAAE